MCFAGPLSGGAFLFVSFETILTASYKKDYTIQVILAFNGGVADTAAIDVTIYGIGLKELDGSVVLYPNPAEDFIYLRGAPANTTFELRNTTGQLLRSGTLTERIDLRGVASGTLLLTLKNQHTIKQYKLVKR